MKVTNEIEVYENEFIEEAKEWEATLYKRSNVDFLEYAKVALPKAIKMIEIMKKSLVRISTHEVGMKAAEATGALKLAAKILED